MADAVGKLTNIVLVCDQPVIAGSHAAGTWYMPRSFFDERALVFDEGAFGEVPDVEADRDARVGSYDAWWDVPVAEVSQEASVRAARTSRG